MSNVISNIISKTPAISSAKLDGIQFNSIEKSGFNSTSKYVLKNTPWYTGNTSTSIKPAVNAVDIDWNEAVIPYGNLETGDSVTINSTGELLSLISQISETQKKSYYTIDTIKKSSQKFYHDLVSNKKVYIEDKPVIRYREISDGGPKSTIYAYVLTDYMGVPYVIEYNISIANFMPIEPSPINTSSINTSSINTSAIDPSLIDPVPIDPTPVPKPDPAPGPTPIQPTKVSVSNKYNYFSPIVLIDVNSNSTVYSSTSIDIFVNGDVINIPINDEFVIYFLQSCDIFTKVDRGDTYWRLDGRNIGSVTSSTSNTIIRYVCQMDVSHNIGENVISRVSITWDLNAKTITTLMD